MGFINYIIFTIISSISSLAVLLGDFCLGNRAHAHQNFIGRINSMCTGFFKALLRLRRNQQVASSQLICKVYSDHITNESP